MTTVFLPEELNPLWKMTDRSNYLQPEKWAGALRTMRPLLPLKINCQCSSWLGVNSWITTSPILDQQKVRSRNLPKRWRHVANRFLLSKGVNGSAITCCNLCSQCRMHPECFPIAVDRNDPFYADKGVHCLDFVRSAPAPQCEIGWDINHSLILRMNRLVKRESRQAGESSLTKPRHTLTGPWSTPQLDLKRISVSAPTSKALWGRGCITTVAGSCPSLPSPRTAAIEKS